MVAEALARMMGQYWTLKMRSQGTRMPPSPWVLILAMMLLVGGDAVQRRLNVRTGVTPNTLMASV